MKILLPMDDSKYSEEALRTVLTQFEKRGAQVRVLHVIEPVTAFVTAGFVPEFANSHVAIEEDRRKQAKALVALAAQKLRKAGFKATEEIETGDAKTVIIDHAAHWDADLIVLGSHGLKGLSRFLMGSVSDAVIRHAGCSVQVVRPRGSRKVARAHKS